VVIGEAVKNLSSETRESAPDLEDSVDRLLAT
jgi:uncharacterized protein with HEPN domain